MNRTTLLRTLLLAAVLFPLLLPAAPDSPASPAAPDTTALTAAPTNPTREELDSIRRAGKSFEVRVPDRSCALIDINMPRSLIGTGRRLFQVRNHPGLDSLFTEAEMAQIRAEIDARCDSLGKDSLLSSELFYVLRPYLDRLHYEDPHYRILLPPIGDAEHYTRREQRRIQRTLPTPGFNLL